MDKIQKDEMIVRFHEDERGIVRSWDVIGKLVRCKDCKWWDKQEMSLQGRCSLLQMYPTGEWYCGNAKLRYTMEEFMHGQDMGNPEDGSL